MTQQVKNPPEMQEMQETQVWSLCQEYSLEEGMATCSSILAGKIPWTEDPGGLGCMTSQRVGHDYSYTTIERDKAICYSHLPKFYRNFQSLSIYEKKNRSRKMKRALQSLQWDHRCSCSHPPEWAMAVTQEFFWCSAPSLPSQLYSYI